MRRLKYAYRQPGRQRLLTAIVISFICVLFLPAAGCGAGGAGQPAFTLDVAEAGQRLYQELEFRDQLEELNPVVVYTLLGIDESHVAAQKNYFGSGATAEEVVVLQAVDQEALQQLRFALEARLETQIDIYADYAPEEVSYLRGAVLEEKDVYIILCVAADADAAARLVGELFAE